MMRCLKPAKWHTPTPQFRKRPHFWLRNIAQYQLFQHRPSCGYDALLTDPFLLGKAKES